MDRIGIIIGRFMPPHRGHEYLVHFAEAFAEEVWIFTCTLPNEAIPGEERFEWCKELFPRSRHVHIHEVNPAANRNQDGAQKIWARAVLSHVQAQHPGRVPDYIFASENYGWDFAAALGARFIPVDPSRDQFPISGSEVRERPFRHWHFLSSPVRSWFVKEVFLEFPQAWHADTLLRTSALLLQTLYVPDYEEFFADFAAGAHQLKAGDSERAWSAQKAALRRQARFFLLSTSRGARAREEADLIVAFREADVQEEDRHRTILVNCTPETCAFALRDALHDRYSDWL